MGSKIRPLLRVFVVLISVTLTVTEKREFRGPEVETANTTITVDGEDGAELISVTHFDNGTGNGTNHPEEEGKEEKFPTHNGTRKNLASFKL